MKKGFLVLFALLVGCLQPPAAQPEGAQKWALPEELKVTQEPATAQAETVILVDLSASNTFRKEMFTEVTALVAQVPDDEEVCVLQISEDSRSSGSAPWCRGLVDAFKCTHQPIKLSGWANSTKEKPAYLAAEARIKQEMVACEAERQQDMARRRVTAKATLKAWIAAARTTHWTDLQGAIFRAQDMSKNGWGTIWIYSDMEDDPDPQYQRAATLQVDLAGWEVSVRQIRKSGAGYDTTWQTLWTQLFPNWGNPTMDWKDFYEGEFKRPELLEVPASPVSGPRAGAQPTSRPTGSPLFQDKPGARK